MHVTDRMCVARGTCPPSKIFDFRPSEILLVLFWGETARVCIVFETFKRSHNLKAWLGFAREKNFS